jgi:hypothetical protein
MKREREQITVPISAELRTFLEELAAREERTIAGQVRHLIAQAARQNQNIQEVA